MDICTFWYGKSLRKIDKICLSSMVLSGHKVKLFLYKNLDNVPSGVELHDAEKILPYSYLLSMKTDYSLYHSKLAIVQFSDIFRIMLMKHKQGIWFDTDVYLVKKIYPNIKKIWIARENYFRLGVSVLYFPEDNPIILEFEKYINGNNKIPNWLGFKRRIVRPFLLKVFGFSIHTTFLGNTIFGNDGISRLAKKFNFFSEAYPKETFYYWTGRKSERIFDSYYSLKLLQNKNFIGFHFHRKKLTECSPKKGSFYYWAIDRIKNNNLL